MFRAVVICDDFDNAFCPLTLTGPRCLLPVANRPNLAYIIEHLICCGVQEIIIVSNRFGEKIREFVLANYQNKVGNICKFISSNEFESIGDVFRCFDRDNILSKEQPFILMSGSVVTNVNLRRLYDEYVKTNEKQPNACLTMALSSCPLDDDQSYFIAHDEGKRILSFRSPGLSNMPIDTEAGIFKAKIRKRVHLRLDLRSAGVFVCSPKIPGIFADPANLDLCSMNDFVKQTLDDEHMGIGTSEVFFSKIWDEEFGDIIISQDRLMSITKAIFDRKVSPFTPCYQFRARQLQPYSQRKKENYRGQNIRIAPTAVVEKRSVIGDGVEIGAGSFVTNSCIGDDCKIGDNVHIENSVIDTGSMVESSSKIFESFLGKNSRIVDGSLVMHKSIIGDHVSAKIQSERGVVLCNEQFCDTDDEFDGLVAMSAKEAILDGKVYGEDICVWAHDDDITDDGVTIDQIKNCKKFWNGNRTTLDDSLDDYMDSLASEEEEESDEESFDEEKQRQKNLQLFNIEVKESVTRCISEKLASADVIPEITGSRNSYAVEVPQIVRAIGLALYSLSQEELNFSIQNFQSHVKTLKDLLENFLCPGEKPNVKMQMEFLQFVNEEYEITKKLTQKVFLVMYQLDLLDERVILHWFAEYDIKENLKTDIAEFIDYLEQDDSTEESD